jgi:PAS domain S-box-containing protein
MIEIRSIRARYLSAVIFVVAALATRLLLEPFFQGKLPYTPFYLAIVLTAWLGGLGPTLVATVLSLFCVNCIVHAISPPLLVMLGPGMRAISFLIVGGSIAVLSGMLHHTQRKAAEAARQALAKHTQFEREAAARAEVERRFQAFMDHTSAIAVIKDRQGKFVYVNRRYCDLFEGPPEKFIGQTVFERFPNAVAELMHAQDESVMTTGTPSEIVVETPRPDGGVRWFLTSKFPFDSFEQPMLGMMAIDISARVLAERELLQAHDVLESRVRQRTAELEQERSFIRQVLDTSPNVMYVGDGKGKVVLANEALARLLGMKVDELVGADVSLFISRREDYERYLATERLVMETGQTIAVDDTFTTADGRTVWFHLVEKPLHLPDGTTHVLAIGTDITERKRAEEDLQYEREFLVNTLESHERDRKLLAYEIHDGVVQYLAGSIFKLESVRDNVTFANDDDVDAFDSTIITLRRALDEARRFMGGLRPLVIDEAGIGTALEYLVAEHRIRGDLDVDFENHSSIGRLDPLLENTVFRIAQEALTNAARHSGTKNASLVLSQINGSLLLEVVDRGRGFDSSQPGSGRFGIEGIRKRAAVVQGTARIETVPGGGTRVAVELPIRERFDDAVTPEPASI